MQKKNKATVGGQLTRPKAKAACYWVQQTLNFGCKGYRHFCSMFLCNEKILLSCLNTETKLRQITQPAMVIQK